jgi:hypothetical protein
MTEVMWVVFLAFILEVSETGHLSFTSILLLLTVF